MRTQQNMDHKISTLSVRLFLENAKNILCVFKRSSTSGTGGSITRKNTSCIKMTSKMFPPLERYNSISKFPKKKIWNSSFNLKTKKDKIYIYLIVKFYIYFLLMHVQQIFEYFYLLGLK